MSNRWFSQSYSEAAGRFSMACDSLREGNHQVRHERLMLGMEGPEKEPLAIDIAVVGSLDSGKVLLSSSGIHGVEGYPGSAIQLSIMDEMAKQDPFEDHAVIFIHTVNPYGMAWWRRFNENNVDLNRNFLTSRQSYSGTPEGYEYIREFFNPQTPPKLRDRSFLFKALGLIMRHGFNNLKQWVAEGQYEYPKAIQFGGKSLQHGPKLLLEWLDENLKTVSHIWAIDLHTGLGPSGHDTLLVSPNTSNSKLEKLNDLFPGHVESLDPNAGVGYQIDGDLHQGLEDRYDKINWTSITQEFGTFSPVKVIRASRTENRWTQWGQYDSQQEAKRHWSRLKMLRTFNPDDTVWQDKVVSRGKIVFNCATNDLSNL
mgnify:FL=1